MSPGTDLDSDHESLDKISCIPNKYLSGLDPEWKRLWEEHGSKVIRADEVSVFELRKNPARYDFRYAKYSGKF